MLSALVRFTELGIYLIVPGSILNRSKRTIFTYGFLPVFYVCLLLFSLANFLTKPETLIGIMIAVLTFHSLTLFYYGIVPNWVSIKKINYRSTLIALLLIAVFNSIFLAIGYSYKSRLFGIELFYIPTESMTPAILPGDIAIVDTWITLQDLNEGDVIVFRHPHIHQMNLVKRVSKIHDDSHLSVLGDNKRQSLDSRLLGQINSNLLVGRVETLFRNRAFIEM